MKKELDYIVESVVKKVILEYGGVSDEIINISNSIFDKIFREHRNYSRKQTNDEIFPDFNGHKLFKKRFYLTIDSLDLAKIVNSILVELYFYDSSSENYDDLFHFLNKNSFIYNHFSPSKKMIRFTFPWPSYDNFDNNTKTKILSTINHEVKHAYQDSKRNGTNISNQYFNATVELNRPMGYNKEADTVAKELVDYYVPWIYYRLDKDEINAFMQELYIEAQHFGDIKKGEVYKNLIKTIENYEYLKDLYLSKEDYYQKQGIKFYIDKSIKRIDEPNNYFKVCDRNIEYLKGKMRRVIGRWNEEQKITNGSFKQYATNEIPQEYAFRLKKKNPSLWRKLVQRFKFS